MTTLVTLLDNLKNDDDVIQLGENQHIEYAWTKESMDEQIMQLYFQLVRTGESQMDILRQKFDDIMKQILKLDDASYMSIILRLLCQTRDIVSGKGEYSLAYMMLMVINKYNYKFAEYILETFVQLDDGIQPYGSWKDIKYIACQLRTEMNKSTDDHDKKKFLRLTDKCVRLINDKLVKDVVCENDSDISLCPKWVPRECSKKHGFFFKLLAKDFYKNSHFMKTAHPPSVFPTEKSREDLGNALLAKPTTRFLQSRESIKKANKKCFMKYRQMIADLNKRIDTVQIKQCNKSWKDIDHNKTTSITISRNKKAFLNIDKMGEIRSADPDRIACAMNFKKYIDSRIKSGKEVKGTKVGLNNFTRQAFELIRKNPFNTIEADLLNSQWRSNSSLNGGLNKMIAMVDTSGSMEGEPLEVAIALGIRVAEKSILGKRVLTFSEKPTWHNLENDNDFVSMVRNLKGASWTMNTNFYAALELILLTLLTNKVPPEDADGLVLAIFSDMQIDAADKSYKTGSMIDNIKGKYETAGYKCPHILFWNLRSTSGFPSLSDENGASMMSGFSPVLLNQFCEKGMEALDQATPFNMMLESLNNERYSCIDKFVKENV